MARLVEVGAAGVEVADGKGVPAGLAQGGDQHLPVGDFREEVRHVDADQPEHGELNSDHAVGLRQAAIDLAVVAERATGGDQHTAAARWRCEGRRMPIAEGLERRA
jgi:hypothetical protein